MNCTEESVITWYDVNNSSNDLGQIAQSQTSLSGSRSDCYSWYWRQ